MGVATGDTFSILIVDDDAAVIRVLRNILAEFSPLICDLRGGCLEGGAPITA